MGVVVEPREDEVIVTVASGWRLETWVIHEDWRELVSVIDAG